MKLIFHPTRRHGLNTLDGNAGRLSPNAGDIHRGAMLEAGTRQVQVVWLPNFLVNRLDACGRVGCCAGGNRARLNCVDEFRKGAILNRVIAGGLDRTFSPPIPNNL